MFGFLAMYGPWGLGIAAVVAAAIVGRVLIREHYRYKRAALHDQTLLSLAKMGAVGETDPNSWVAAVNQPGPSRGKARPRRDAPHDQLVAGPVLHSVDAGLSDVAQ